MIFISIQSLQRMYGYMQWRTQEFFSGGSTNSVED